MRGFRPGRATMPHGGWLFGMAFGFALWAGGAVLVLPLASGGRAPAGSAASALPCRCSSGDWRPGSSCPFVHRPLHESLESGRITRRSRADAAARQGPAASASSAQQAHSATSEPMLSAAICRAARATSVAVRVVGAGQRDHDQQPEEAGRREGADQARCCAFSSMKTEARSTPWPLRSRAKRTG